MGEIECQRRPIWLRVVVSAEGGIDVLDRLHDEPRSDERIYVYKRIRHQGGSCGLYGESVYTHHEIGALEANEVYTTSGWRRWVETISGERLDAGGRPLLGVFR